MLARLGAAGIIAILIALVVVLDGYYTVEQGEIGLKRRFGEIVGTADAGLHFKIPIVESVVKLSIRTEKASYDDIESYSRDIQASRARVTTNVRLDPAFAQAIYAQYGENYVERVVEPQLLRRLKEVIGQYVAADIIAQRAKLGLDIEAALRSAVPEGILVESVQIENINFSEAYEAAIEQAMQAEAEVRKVRNQQERERVAADTLVIQARGQAQSVRERAMAEADAIKLRGEAEAAAISAKSKAMAETPRLVELIAAERWNGALPATQVPGAAVPFITLPQPAPAAVQ